MQALRLQTEHLGHLAGDFSVLPSPSTFFGGTSAFPGDPVVDYTLPSPSTAAFEYQAAFNDYSGYTQGSTVSSASTPEWSGSDRTASSPATSHRSTPRSSPILDKGVVVLPADNCAQAYGQQDSAVLGDDSCDPLWIQRKLLQEHPGPLADAQHPVVPLGQDASASFASFDALDAPVDVDSDGLMFAFAPAPSVPSPYAQEPFGAGAQQQHFQVPSPAPSNASAGYYHVDSRAPSPYQQHAYPSHEGHATFGHEAASAGFAAGQFAAAAPSSLVAHQHQQQGFVPVQFTTINGATYAVAVPVSAPVPAAIETPHGTYYFVPNPAAAAPVVPAVPEQQQEQLSPAPAPVLVNAAAALDEKPSLVLPTGATVPASALPTAMSAQQKIRLPVGQGKRGSTKRTAKKDQPKRFICPHPGCGRAFARNFNMSSHYKSHLGVREFSCPVCPKMFSRRHDRARHCAAVHDSHVDRDGNFAAAGSSLCGDELDLEHDEYDTFGTSDLGVGPSGST